MRAKLAPITGVFLAGLLALPVAAEISPEPGIKLLVPSGSKAMIELAAPSEDDDMLRQLDIEAGKSVFARTEYRVKRVSVGNPDIVDVVVISQRELQLVAKKVGTTNLLIWDTSGEPQGAIDIHVGAPHSRIQSELRRILGSDDITVESAGNGVVLKGSLESKVAMEQAMTVARAVLEEDGREAKRVVNLLEVRGQHQVMLEVVVAEMSRAFRKRFGTNVNGLISSSQGDIQFFSFLQGLTLDSATIETDAEVTGTALVGAGSVLAAGASLAGPAAVGDRCTIEEGARVAGSVLWDDVTVGAGATVEGSVLATGAVVGAGAELDGAVVAHEARVTAGVSVPRGQMIEPGTTFDGTDVADRTTA